MRTGWNTAGTALDADLGSAGGARGEVQVSSAGAVLGLDVARLDLDGFVSETIGLDGVEEAFHKMERREVLRSVVVL